MSRLIDADALKKTVDDFPNCYNGWSDAYDKAYIIEAIEGAPTIDAVEVVRCIDCRWYRLFDKCFFSTAELCPDDFCSYGERKRCKTEQTEREGE